MTASRETLASANPPGFPARVLRVVAGATLAFSLAACGFQLRGSYRLPDALFPLHIEAPGGSAVARELRDTLSRQDLAVTDAADTAAMRLVILDESSERRILSVGSSAKVGEYELLTTVRWKLVDRGSDQADPALGPVDLRARRDYRFDPDAVLSKEAEENALYADMSGDLAQRILFRLQSWSPGQD